MNIISVTMKGDIKKWVDTIAQSQIPFATAKTLTDLSARLGQTAAKTAAQEMQIRKPWSARFKASRIGGKPTGTTAFSSTGASYKVPIANMQAIVGTVGWQIAQQIAEQDTIRKPMTAQYRYIPLRAKRTKKESVAVLLKHKDSFVRDTDKGRILFFRKGKEIIPMYKLVPEQEIKPRFGFIEQVQHRAPRLYPVLFNRAMDEAIKKYKPKK